MNVVYVEPGEREDVILICDLDHPAVTVTEG